MRNDMECLVYLFFYQGHSLRSKELYPINLKAFLRIGPLPKKSEEQNFQVQQQRSIRQVVAIRLNAAVQTVATIGLRADLRPTHKARLHPVQIVRGEPRAIGLARWPGKWRGADERHVSAKDIEEQENLVKVSIAKKLA